VFTYINEILYIAMRTCRRKNPIISKTASSVQKYSPCSDYYSRWVLTYPHKYYKRKHRSAFWCFLCSLYFTAQNAPTSTHNVKYFQKFWLHYRQLWLVSIINTAWKIPRTKSPVLKSTLWYNSYSMYVMTGRLHGIYVVVYYGQSPVLWGTSSDGCEQAAKTNLVWKM